VRIPPARRQGGKRGATALALDCLAMQPSVRFARLPDDFQTTEFLTADFGHVVFQVGFSSQLVFSSMKAAFDL
jgi:hypothetical protein